VCGTVTVLQGDIVLLAFEKILVLFSGHRKLHFYNCTNFCLQLHKIFYNCTICAQLHTKKNPVAWCAFFDIVLVFELLTPKFSKGTEKFSKNRSFFGEKRPLNGNILKFRYERIHLQMDSRIFLSSFAEIGKAKVIKRVRGIPSREKVGILPLSLLLLERSRQKFYRIAFSPFLIICQLLSKCVQFSRR